MTTLDTAMELVNNNHPAPNFGPTIMIPPSPAPTALSFKQGDDQDAIKPMEQEVVVTSPPRPVQLQQRTNAVEFITRDIDRDTPGTPGLNKKSSKGTMSRKRSTKGANYYGEVFGVRQTPTIPKMAGVCVELKTNVILENEFDFARKVSAMIAKRYNRGEESVCVTLDHSACMIMGGTFDGTYILTITSVSMISPTVNKRNAALIMDWFKANMGVSPNRAFIRFVDPEFANYATSGITILDLMEKEELARTGSTERTGMIREKSTRRSASRRKAEKSTPAPAESRKDTASVVSDGALSPVKQGAKMRKKSMFNLFSKNP